MNLRTKLRRLFLEWMNDYLTVAVFAENNDMSVAVAYRVIWIGRELHNRRASA